MLRPPAGTTVHRLHDAWRIRLPDELERGVQLFQQFGFVILDEALDQTMLQGLAAQAEVALKRCQAAVERRTGAGLPLGTNQGYAEIVHRAPGRYDLLHGLDHPGFTHPLLNIRSAWQPLLHALLGDEYRKVYQGLLMAEPGAGEHVWHADGEHLFGSDVAHLPPHCVNVFIPLVPVGLNNGATEFCPGSHFLSRGLREVYEQDDDLPERAGVTGPSVTPELPLGSVVLFDYRLIHRARANVSGQLRPVLYQTYTRPWFQDVRNFPERSVFGDEAAGG